MPSLGHALACPAELRRCHAALCLAMPSLAQPLRCPAMPFSGVPHTAVARPCQRCHTSPSVALPLHGNAQPSFAFALPCSGTPSFVPPCLCTARPFSASRSTPLLSCGASHFAQPRHCPAQPHLAKNSDSLPSRCHAWQCLAVAELRQAWPRAASQSNAIAMRSIAQQRFTLPSPRAAWRHFAFAVPSGSLFRASQLCLRRAKDRDVRPSIAFAERLNVRQRYAPPHLC